MAGMRSAFVLVLTALLLNLSLVSTLEDHAQNFEIATSNPLDSNDALSPNQVNELKEEASLPSAFDLCAEPGSSCVTTGASMQRSKPIFPNEDAASDMDDYDNLGKKVQINKNTASTISAKPTTFAVVTQAIPTAPSTLATYGASCTTISFWTRPSIVQSESAQIKKRHTASALALPCVTTLATYGVPGFSLSNWAPPGASCPTTLASAVASKGL